MNSETPASIDAFEQMCEEQIDAALTAYPLAPLPRNFTRQIMAKVATTPQEQTAIALHTVPTNIMRRYLYLYGFEFVTATLLTFLLGCGFIWPLFAQTAPLSAFGLNTLGLGTQLLTRLAAYFSSWYALGLASIVFLESGILLLIWIKWFELPEFEAR